MPSTSRRSTPARRARSSSVASNVSAASTKSTRSNSKPSLPASASAAAGLASATPTKSPARARASKAASAAASAAAELKAAEAAVSAAADPSRPQLPKESNPVLPDEGVPVKLQVIRRDAKNIIIGRVKLPTVNGTDHAFLLKRFDTNALAASSMFRIAFPYASSAEEKAEMAYLESRYDVERANGGSARVSSSPPKRKPGRPKKQTPEEIETESHGTGSTGVRLQGTWIPCADAIHVAAEYGLLRFVKPLVEARAAQSESGALLLTPSKHDSVSTPTGATSSAPSSAKRARKVEETQTVTTTAGEASPTVTRTRTTTDADGSVKVEQLAVGGSALTPEQIEAEIKASQALAAGVQAQAAASGEASSGRKRRATNQRPTADLDPLADDDAEEAPAGNAVVRSVRRGAGVVRRRPVATTAGALASAGAIGAGALAWMAGGNLDVAQQIVSQGVASISAWFL